MITVRFSSGFSVQYNDLNWVEYGGDHRAYLYTKQGDGGWKVQVPNEALIEFVTPCRTYNAATDATADKVWELVREVRLAKTTLAKLSRQVARVRK